ncbi:hypothetical protein Misp01_76740 [Microtetraspora sp. NBRC 13810]|uniref:hypothetical protein n=1 Tax=Microtetraspora sp. NBRC 13810 TaxID=3030990 RepID=UPI0024A3D66C|nr:hypothetical protein [Microtetraspora sp. NBRC 13810]GLW12546.1 hypothetical protein Misp01_76740 [Microtetraspora sp. NBRC 13810]
MGALWVIAPEATALSLVLEDPYATAYPGASGVHLFVGLVLVLTAFVPVRPRQ